MDTLIKKQINLRCSAPGTYIASWHIDWTVGAVFHGGCVAAVIHHVAEVHLASDPTFKTKNHPDIYNLHFEFLRPCVRQDSIITVTALRIGAAASTLQLELYQDGQKKVLALATTNGFNKILGPTVPVPAARIENPQPEPPLTSTVYWPTSLMSTGSPLAFQVKSFQERIDATYVAMLTDMIPSMSDTLLRNGALYDAHSVHRRSQEWANAHPGTPARIMNTAAEALKSSTFNSTQTLDIEFTRKVPPEGLRFVFTRTAANSLQKGRMNVDITICDEIMELLCTAHQQIFVLETGRKFRTGSAKGPSL
ncbi:thioesterase-like superfamily-domain-containing protein [Xylariaceae sp. FL0255]|nr:thioesterase-like superfamily-domain-containing protein [Xylariaceae sp. FL0255]